MLKKDGSAYHRDAEIMKVVTFRLYNGYGFHIFPCCYPAPISIPDTLIADCLILI